jgi:Acetyltransferase (GNAT) domain
MRIRTLRTVQELEAVKDCWSRWQVHVNSDFTQFSLLCKLRPEVSSPCVIVVENESGPAALIACRLESASIAPPIGYLKPPPIRARVVSVIHHGVVGSLDDAAAKEVVNHLWSMLASHDADAVHFHHLPEGSPLLEGLWRDGPSCFTQKSPRWTVHREMLLPPDSAAVERTVSAKHRSWLRKRASLLEDAYPGRTAWRWLRSFDDVAALCARLEEASARSYQRGLGTGFYDNEEFRSRLALFASRGMLRVQTLEIDGRVRAFWFGIVYGNVFHSSETGYDVDLRDYEVGTLMFLRMVRELVNEGVARLDFGLGDAQYKQRFGNRSWRETSAWMFAPTAKGFSLMLTIRLCGAIDRTARQLVERVGLTDKLRTAWRRHRAGREIRLASLSASAQGKS